MLSLWILFTNFFSKWGFWIHELWLRVFWVFLFDLLIYFQNGGWGSTWAAPIATLMIEKYLKKEISKPYLEEFILKGNLLLTP